MAQIPKQIIPHKLYKVNASALGLGTEGDVEVVLERDCDWLKNEDGSHGRVTHWLVRQVTIRSGTFPNADYSFGEPIRVAASELRPMMRTIKAAA